MEKVTQTRVNMHQVACVNIRCQSHDFVFQLKMRDARVKIAGSTLGKTLKADSIEALEKGKSALENDIVRVQNYAPQQHS